MSIPTYLKHEPVLAVEDYARKDGVHKNKTDARFLSIGYAQYDRSHFSAKVFRYTGSAWSRQSEELPLHRILDLAILIAGAIRRNDKNEPSITYLDESVISADGFNDLKQYLSANKQHFDTRLAELKRLL